MGYFGNDWVWGWASCCPAYFSRNGDVLMEFLKKFFEEVTGEPSMMRAMSLLSLLIGGGVAFYSLIKGAPIDSTAVGIFVGAAFGGKLWQKSLER